MPSTTVKWHDQSAITTTVPEVVDNAPLFLAFSSFDRGPEDLRVVKGSQFFNLYGNKMRFDRHGQPAIQAANMINGGARLLVKRLVADDALLANAIVTGTVAHKISVTKAEEGDLNAKTVDQILGVDEERAYTDQLNITSTVGVEDDTTTLSITPEKAEGNKYVYKVSKSNLALVVDTDVSGDEWTEWDGASDIAVEDGTSLFIVECDANYAAKKAGSIKVTSKIPHPNHVSTDPTNGLPALYITSTDQGCSEGFTKLVVSPAKGEGNVYKYIENIHFLDKNLTFDESELSDWTSWNGEDQIYINDETVITLIEFSRTEIPDPEDPEADPTVLYSAIKGAAVVTCSKLPDDTRESTSPDIVVPNQDLYIVTADTTTFKWEVSFVTNCKTKDEVEVVAADTYTDNDPEISGEEGSDDAVITESKTFPVFYAVDNGRGDSQKRFRFLLDSATSKDLANSYYNVLCYNGSTLIENAYAALNPSVIFGGNRYGLNSDTSEQIIYDTIDGAYDDMINYIAKLTGYEPSAVKSWDLTTGFNNRGSEIPGFSLEDSVDLTADVGVPLEGGSNGAFGDSPFGTNEWSTQAIRLLNGSFDNIIYDVDVYRLTAAFDANYPHDVKDALADLVNFREDFYYFRDYGIAVDSYTSIVEYYNSFKPDRYSRYIGDYYTTYQIYDPETRVRERVTMMYDFARVATQRLAYAAHLPLAGYANMMIMESAINGTINFTPRRLPSVDQKQLLKDMRLNYAIFEDGNCIVQSLFTSQKEYTQLSYANNVIAIQETVRTVRITCPKNRFTFASGSDFTSYANSVNSVLQQFRANFRTLSFGYQQDSIKAAQKLFYATITYSFHNWVEDEHFDLFAVNADEEE